MLSLKFSIHCRQWHQSVLSTCFVFNTEFTTMKCLQRMWHCLFCPKQFPNFVLSFLIHRRLDHDKHKINKTLLLIIEFLRSWQIEHIVGCTTYDQISKMIGNHYSFYYYYLVVLLSSCSNHWPQSYSPKNKFLLYVNRLKYSSLV